jgi:hypothetical protein
MNYYEIEFDLGYGICIKGLREPSIDEVKEFCKQDMLEFMVDEVISITPISYDDACKFYDMNNEPNWPVFGQ